MSFKFKTVCRKGWNEKSFRITLPLLLHTTFMPFVPEKLKSFSLFSTEKEAFLTTLYAIVKTFNFYTIFWLCICSKTATSWLWIKYSDLNNHIRTMLNNILAVQFVIDFWLFLNNFNNFNIYNKCLFCHTNIKCIILEMSICQLLWKNYS